MSGNTRTINKIYSRGSKRFDYEKYLNMGEWIFLALLLVSAVSALYGVKFFKVFALILFLAGAVVYAVVNNKITSVRMADLDLDASFIVRQDVTDEYGHNKGEELYYVYNKDIMHKNVVREEKGYRHRYGTWVKMPDEIRGPVAENRKKTFDTIHDGAFQERLNVEINRESTEYDGWSIVPVKKVYRILPGLLGNSVLIAGRRGMKEKITVAWDINDRKELMSKIKALKGR
ncbi:MAG: hypothetical protein IJM37_07390 [Lachnospiraceae bacterium]|nr:hypothetical protein [Lachnospiraceae bacterium]